MCFYKEKKKRINRIKHFVFQIELIFGVYFEAVSFVYDEIVRRQINKPIPIQSVVKMLNNRTQISILTTFTDSNDCVYFVIHPCETFVLQSNLEFNLGKNWIVKINCVNAIKPL